MCLGSPEIITSSLSGRWSGFSPISVIFRDSWPEDSSDPKAPFRPGKNHLWSLTCFHSGESFMRHTGLTFCSLCGSCLRYEISQSLVPIPLPSRPFGRALDGLYGGSWKKGTEQGATGAGCRWEPRVLLFSLHWYMLEFSVPLRCWLFPFSRSQCDKSGHFLSSPEMQTSNTSGSSHKGSTLLFKVDVPHP